LASPWPQHLVFVSEAADTEIYTRYKVTFLKKVFASGAVSGLLDSVLFIVIGLSPLISGFLPWSQVPAAIMGQYIVKLSMQVIGIACCIK
jgi:uncharacterized PurR-regulated membrane protein YhhQ (DUF165 family)